jgi:RNA polymerase sigma factor (sigma-70 family)
LDDPERLKRFETTVLVHLDAAYNLARWIVRDDAAADDAVQEASLRAFRFFDRLYGPSPKAWFMAIVRNACLDRLKEHRRHERDESFDDDAHTATGRTNPGHVDPPEVAAARASEARWLRECIDTLPREYREVLILRELEELSYKEISAIVDVPIGTVMSRLARGRDLLHQRLSATRAWRSS